MLNFCCICQVLSPSPKKKLKKKRESNQEPLSTSPQWLRQQLRESQPFKWPSKTRQMTSNLNPAGHSLTKRSLPHCGDLQQSLISTHSESRKKPQNPAPGRAVQDVKQRCAHSAQLPPPGGPRLGTSPLHISYQPQEHLSMDELHGPEQLSPHPEASNLPSNSQISRATQQEEQGCSAVTQHSSA